MNIRLRIRLSSVAVVAVTGVLGGLLDAVGGGHRN